MTDKIREELEKWYKSQAVFHKAHLVPLPNGCYSGLVAETAWRAWQAAQTVPEAYSEIFASRCPMCSYQHGHQIGCENNPIDIALRASAAAPKKEPKK